MHRRWNLILLFFLFLFVIASYAATDNNKLLTTKPPFTQAELTTIQQYLLNNIATDTRVITKNDNGKIIRSKPGAVIASPSDQGKNFSQDYLFHWIRDSAISMNEVAYLYATAAATEKPILKSYLLNYINFERIAQQQISKPGEQTLGQPKYNIDATIWEGQWMRPQNDGPALRAITMLHIAKIFSQQGQETFVRNNMLNIITTDLNYLANHWQDKSYGPWEEINDAHFFNKIVQRKALLIGADFFNQLGNHTQAAFYQAQAQQISKSLAQHWNPSLGYFSETLNQTFYKGGGIDSTIILGVLYGKLDNPNDEFALDNDKVLSSIYFIRNAFAGLYKINLSNFKDNILIGRYPSDIYDGNKFIYGNPWILTSDALAQYYYELANLYLHKGIVIIDQENSPFFKQIGLNLNKQMIKQKNNPDKFNLVINTLIQAGDKILTTVKQHTVCYPDYSCLHLSEQIDRASNKQVSAKDLTWGYATLLTAMQARENLTKSAI